MKMRNVYLQGQVHLSGQQCYKGKNMIFTLNSESTWIFKQKKKKAHSIKCLLITLIHCEKKKFDLILSSLQQSLVLLSAHFSKIRFYCQFTSTSTFILNSLPQHTLFILNSLPHLLLFSVHFNIYIHSQFTSTSAFILSSFQQGLHSLTVHCE